MGKNGLTGSRFHTWTGLGSGRNPGFCIVIEAGPIQRGGAEDAEERREKRAKMSESHEELFSAILGVLCASAVN